jgi:hypothetical protein
LLNTILSDKAYPIQIRVAGSHHGSVSEVPAYLQANRLQFDILCFTNAFDHVLIYADIVKAEDKAGNDKIADAKPCERPALLAQLLTNLGRYATPYLSRGILLQEWAHAALVPVSLPNSELEIHKTRIVHETLRPDVEEETMSVRFAYCGFKYGSGYAGGVYDPVMLPLREEGA